MNARLCLRLARLLGLLTFALAFGTLNLAAASTDGGGVPSPRSVEPRGEGTPPPVSNSTATATHTLLFFGDSITAGYGLDDPANEAYAGVIRKKIAAEHLSWRVVNAGLSGETTAGGLRRVDWILRQPADIFVLALGGNDGLRGIDPAVSRENLQGIIDHVRAKYPNAKIVLAGMMMPSNLGEEYTRAFAAVYPALAEKNHLAFVPFLLKGVGGIPALNQADGIHPTPEGHALIAETLWESLRPLL